MKIIVVMNHKPTDEQVVQLLSMGYTDIEFRQHPQIPPEWDMENVRSLFLETLGASKGVLPLEDLPDALWVQGDYRFFMSAVEFAVSFEIPLYVATTKREVKEEKMPDGSIRKISTFKHVKFIRVA